MILFRVDRHKYKVGDTIEPKGAYISKESKEAEEVEKNLNDFRKDRIPERKDCLFLFYNLSSAMLLWSKYGGTIYAVEPSHIYYRGDMNKLDNILDVFKYSSDYDIRKSVISEYWKEGTHVFQPCFEFLVEKAKVIEIVVDNGELDLFQKQLSELSYSVERTNLFRDLLKIYSKR